MCRDRSMQKCHCETSDSDGRQQGARHDVYYWTFVAAQAIARSRSASAPALIRVGDALALRVCFSTQS